MITIAAMQIIQKDGTPGRWLFPAEVRILWREKPTDERLVEILPDYVLGETIKVYTQEFGENYAVVEE